MKFSAALKRHWPWIVIAIAAVIVLLPVILVLFPGHTSYAVIKP